MSGQSITKSYLRLRTFTALTLIIVAAIIAHMVGHSSQSQVSRKTEVTAALDKVQLSAAEIIINLREIASADDEQTAGPVRAEIRRANRELAESLKRISGFDGTGWLGAETKALIADPLIDPIGLIEDVSVIASSLIEPKSPYGQSASAHVSVGLSLGRQVLPILARMKETERQALETATRGLSFWGSAALFLTIGLVIATGLFIFLPLERRILKAQSDAEHQRETAEAASRAKSEFLATMSHEIRTPMNGVLGMAGLLQKSDLDERQRKFTNIIINSGNALLAIINDILDFSKIEAGKLELETARFDIETTCADVIELLRPQADEKALLIAFERQGDAPAMLLGDEGRLRQVIINLVGNAIKFTQQGSVSLCLKPGTSRDGRLPLQISISDTGVGVAGDKIERIFESFEQADNSSKRSFGGTGLGLAITRRIVQAMGGTISVTSRVGEGSVFTVELTLSEAGDPEIPLSDADSAGLRTMLADKANAGVPAKPGTKAA